MTVNEINRRIFLIKGQIEVLKNEIERTNFKTTKMARELDGMASQIQILPKKIMRSPIVPNKATTSRRLLLPESMRDLLRSKIYQIGLYTLNTETSLLTFKDDTRRLTRKELFLLTIFAANINVFIERDFCLTAIWAENNPFNSRSMDVYICKIRKYLQYDENINLVNRHGQGYILLVGPENNQTI
jgi:DNA-binding winged helix-turn-helix (wHTH) protein